MVDTFATRISAATKKEEEDAALLEQKYRCVVTPFGQGQLTDEARNYLRQHPKPLYIRWLPDRLVIRPALYLEMMDEWMWLIDSKIGRQDTLYWVLEKAAHTAHRLQRDALGLPIVYIWPDGCTCSYVEDLPDEKLIDGPQRGNGSGTPYWLVPKELTRPLDDIFGKGVA